MLSRRALSVAGAAFTALVAASVVSVIDGSASAAPAAQTVSPAANPPSCVSGQGSGQCTISGSSPGSSGSSGGSGQPSGPGGAPVCTFTGVTVPCQNQYGIYNGDDGCYYLPTPQPWPSFGPWATDPNWSKAHPTGTVYNGTCLIGADKNALYYDGVLHWKWFDNPPGTVVPKITPAQAAADFIATLKFDGPTDNVAPPAGSTVLVGMPMWLWSADDADHWGPKAIGPVAFEGYDISLNVRATSITWYPGDGSSFDCDHGTPWDGGAATTACSHTYSTASAAAPGQAFQLYGVTHWSITWTAGGQNNFNNPIHKDVPSNPVPITVGEAQAVVQH